MKKFILFISCAVAGTAAHATLLNDTVPSAQQALKISPDDPQLLAVDNALVANYLNHFCYSKDNNVLNAYGYSPEEIPKFEPAVVAQRMAFLDKETPFDLVYNPTVQGFIDLYAERRRDITSRVLGMSQYYFPHFEEMLAKYDIPLEMKYLAVVESALNPSAISSAKAGGLWQFMVGTGKMYGLEVSSYQDDRFDTYKATEAACKYLKSLYNTFGDWQLALAAYNSGPGNVNKAIRRSGGKRDFWEIKQYLPKETQGYVPAFIAVNYVMNYSTEYNIYPSTYVKSFFEVDTIGVHDRVDFAALSKIVGVSVEEIAFLNSAYKLNVIPDNGKKHYLVLPTNKIGLFMANEDLVYQQSDENVAQPEINYASNNSASNNSSTSASNASATKQKVVYEKGWKTHSVKRGESLGSISNKYNVSLSEIKSWNKIKGSTIYPGQKLKIQTTVKKTVTVADESASASNETDNKETSAVSEEASSEKLEKEVAEATKPKTTEYKYYTVRPGDTLWDIANKYDGVSIDQIKQLNNGLKENKLSVGQKIKIKKIG